jgi:hypothetical protein
MLIVRVRMKIMRSVQLWLSYVQQFNSCTASVCPSVSPSTHHGRWRGTSLKITLTRICDHLNNPSYQQGSGSRDSSVGIVQFAGKKTSS